MNAFIDLDKPLSDKKLHYTLILTQAPNQLESNLTAQKLAAEILSAGDIVDRIFFYQDACYTALNSQVPGQGLESSYQGWVDLHNQYKVPLQACIANSLRRGILDSAEANRYQQSANMQECFQLVGLGELAEACSTSDRIIRL
jgi:tRNA 2-thiouridine synthesizing protein D